MDPSDASAWLCSVFLVLERNTVFVTRTPSTAAACCWTDSRSSRRYARFLLFVVRDGGGPVSCDAPTCKTLLAAFGAQRSISRVVVRMTSLIMALAPQEGLLLKNYLMCLYGTLQNFCPPPLPHRPLQGLEPVCLLYRARLSVRCPAAPRGWARGCKRGLPASTTLACQHAPRTSSSTKVKEGGRQYRQRTAPHLQEAYRGSSKGGQQALGVLSGDGELVTGKEAQDRLHATFLT